MKHIVDVAKARFRQRSLSSFSSGATRIISISVVAAAVCSCAARQVPRDFSPQVAERGAQQDSRSGNMKIYMTRMIASSQAGVELRERYLIRSLARDSSLSRAVARIHWRTRI